MFPTCRTESDGTSNVTSSLAKYPNLLVHINKLLRVLASSLAWRLPWMFQLYNCYSKSKCCMLIRTDTHLNVVVSKLRYLQLIVHGPSHDLDYNIRPLQMRMHRVVSHHLMQAGSRLLIIVYYLKLATLNSVEGPVTGIFVLLKIVLG